MGEQVQPAQVQSVRLGLKWAELHTPAFLAGCNLGMKLDPTKRVGLVLVYDRTEKELLISYLGETGIVPYSNVAIMVEGTIAKPAVAAAPVVVHAPKPHTAQVSGPQSHVFAGPGAGKTK